MCISVGMNSFFKNLKKLSLVQKKKSILITLFHKKNENWRSLKMRFFWVGHFDFFFFKKCFFFLHINKNKQPIHIRFHLFLHYGWFLQNHGIDFIRIDMHRPLNHVLNGTTPKIQHRKWGPQKVEISIWQGSILLQQPKDPLLKLTVLLWI